MLAQVYLEGWFKNQLLFLLNRQVELKAKQVNIKESIAFKRSKKLLKAAVQLNQYTPLIVSHSIVKGHLQASVRERSKPPLTF